MEAPNQSDSLRGKYILVCRTSGVHRLPSYEKLASVGPWSDDKVIRDATPLHRDVKWSTLCEPTPNNPQVGGLGAKLVFLHPFRPKWVEHVAHDWIIADCSDVEGAWKAVQSYITSKKAESSDFNGFDGVVSYDEFSIAACSFISDKLGLTHNTSYEHINTIRNKYKLRQICENIGVPVPRSMLVRISDVFRGTIDDILDDQGYTSPSSVEYSNEDHDEFVRRHLADIETNGVEAIFKNTKTTDSLELESMIDPTLENTDESWHKYYTSKRNALAALTQNTSTNFSTSTASTFTTSTSNVSVSTSDMSNSTPTTSTSTPLLQYPLVIKPLAGAGSNFVRKVNNWTELRSVLYLFAKQFSTMDSNNSLTIDDIAPSPDSLSPSTTIAAESPDLLRFKWNHWGLDAVDTGFMIEEFMSGREMDIDLMIQDGKIKFANFNDNFPTAGHAGHNDYFMEAGGCCVSALPLHVQMGVLTVAQRLINHFNTGGRSISGVWHFEAMIATNMAWTYQPNSDHSFGLMCGPGYACMPIEVNQRAGGSEVVGMTAATGHGLDYVVEGAKIACGVEVPNYFSLMPEYGFMNRFGWNRYPEYNYYTGDGVGVDEKLTEEEMVSIINSHSTLSHSPSVDKLVKQLEHRSFASRIDVTSLPPSPSPPLTLFLPSPQSLLDYYESQPLVHYPSIVKLASLYSLALSIPTPSHYFTPNILTNVCPKFVCSINWSPPRGGSLISLQLADEVYSNPAFLGATLWNNTTDNRVVNVPPVGFDCFGFLFAGGDSIDDAMHNMIALANLLEWTYEEDESS